MCGEIQLTDQLLEKARAESDPVLNVRPNACEPSPQAFLLIDATWLMGTTGRTGA